MINVLNISKYQVEVFRESFLSQLLNWLKFTETYFLDILKWYKRLPTALVSPWTLICKIIDIT